MELQERLLQRLEKQQSQERLKPFVFSEIFERVQIDLVDMMHCPDWDYNWIAHMEDFNGLFHCLWAQKKEGNK